MENLGSSLIKNPSLNQNQIKPRESYNNLSSCKNDPIKYEIDICVNYTKELTNSQILILIDLKNIKDIVKLQKEECDLIYLDVQFRKKICSQYKWSIGFN